MKSEIVISLDFSSISLLNCERRYALRNIAQLGHHDGRQTLFGSVFHDFAARFMPNPAAPPEILLGNITQSLSPRDKKSATALMLGLIPELFGLVQSLPPVAETEHWFEQEFRRIETAKAVYRFLFCGYVDLICGSPPGLLIYDFKTSLSPQMEKLQQYDTSLQLQLYAYALRDKSPSGCAYIFIRPNSSDTKVALSKFIPPNHEAAERALAMAAERIVEIHERLPEIRPTGRLSNVCAACDFKQLCFAEKHELPKLLETWPKKQNANQQNRTPVTEVPMSCELYLTKEG